MFKAIFIVCLGVMGAVALNASAAPQDQASTRITPEEIENARKRVYPGGRDEEEIKVLENLPEATRTIYEKSVQNEVYKALYKEDMANQGDDAPESESESEE